MTFANSLDPDKARQIPKPDLNPNCLILMVTVFLKEICIEKKKPQYSELMEASYTLNWFYIQQTVFHCPLKEAIPHPSF